MREEQHQEEQDRDDPGADLDFADLAGEDTDEHIGDQAERDAVGDVVGEGHHRHREERGQSNGRIHPVEVLDAVDHQNADIDEGRSGGRRRDERGDGAEEHGDEEERSSRHGRKAGSAALCNTGRGLDERRDRGGAADRTGGGGDGVGQHSLVHVGDVAVFGEHVARRGRRRRTACRGYRTYRPCRRPGTS